MQQLLCPTVETFLSRGAKFSNQQSSEFGDWEKNFCTWVIRHNNGRCNVHIHPWVSRAKYSNSEGNSTSSQSLVQSICLVPILHGVDCQLVLYWIFDKFYFTCMMRYTVRLMSSMMISLQAHFFCWKNEFLDQDICGEENYNRGLDVVFSLSMVGRGGEPKFRSIIKTKHCVSHDCCGLNGSVASKFIWWNHDSQGDVIMRRGSGEVVRSLVKETSGANPFHYTCEDTARSLWPRRGPSLEHELTSDLQLPEP